MFGLSPLAIQQHHDQAFDVEAVTKKFFNDFCQTFTAVAKDIRERNNWMDDEAVERETQTLLNRLLFLYFIQRKGWLNRQRDYLYANFRQYHANAPDGANYYSEFLYRLFIKLSTEGEYYETLGGLPFLNGGLFNDEYGGQQRQEVLLRRARMKIGNAIFRRVFDDLLEAYNFTVREDTPLNQEVAIDPEMLGKIFESLVLQIEQSGAGGKTSRHDTGSYYTPRPIVHYLCREGLRCWLEQFPPGANHWPARLEKLLALDAADGLGADERATLDACLAPEEARALLERLDHLRACDPAVGSGAFPVGLLHEVLNLRRLCETRSRGRDPVEGDRNWLYDTKARVIERVLYGVDIQERATEICKLRLWLSLMVDFDPGVDIEQCSAKAFSDALKKIPALPNLDFKIRRANSLIDMVRGHPLNLKHGGPDQKGMLPPILNRLITAKREFYDAHKIADKRRLRFDILDATAELAMYEFSAARTELGLLAADKDRERLAELSAAEREMGWLRQQVRAARKLRAEQQDEALERLGKTFDDEQKPTFVWQLDFAEVFHRSADSLVRNSLLPSEKHADKAVGAPIGFDIVLANPPYVRQEAIKDLKPLFKAQGYECFDGIADLFVYFYERSVQLLRTGGVLSFISSNKYYRAGYGEKLRAFLARELTLRQLLDFGDAPVFDAIAYASILIGSKGAPGKDAVARAHTWQPETPLDDFAQVLRARGVHILQRELKPDGWRLESPATLRLLDKLRQAGQPLGEYVSGRFYRGILTGLNEAFVVDRATRDQLIAEHKSSAEVLKPFLRGRDVKRWRVEFAEQYLIKIESSENKTHPWSGKPEKEAEKVFAETYPAIHARFEPFRKALIQRDDQGKYFWELRSCAYWSEFEKPAMIYPELALVPQYAFSEKGEIADCTLYVVPNADGFLTAIMNSRPVGFFFHQIAPKMRGGYMRFKALYMSQIPIPAVPTEKQKLLERLVDRILAAKQKDPAADTSALEREIDQQVYALYGLTAEEIKIVEDSARK